MSWTDILSQFTGGVALSPLDITIALGFSLLCSVLVLVMYQHFYGKENVGAGVQRSFLLLGPAVTALFIGIQFSLPLSLGLLGSLSIIRFRTPVKDPAEIGFLMLLIAAAVCSATFNYMLVLVLFVVVLIALFGRQFTRQRVNIGRRSLILTLDSPEYAAMEGRLTSFVTGNLSGARLESVSTSAESASLHYLFDKKNGFEWGKFTEELTKLASPAKVSIFIG